MTTEPVTSVAVITVGDHVVRQIMSAMVAGDWGEGSPALIAAQHGCALNTARQWAQQAARFLRIQRAPDVLEQEIVAHLRGILEQSEGDRVAAARVLMDYVERLEKRRQAMLERSGSISQADPQMRQDAVRALLTSPSPELAALLEERLRMPSDWWRSALLAAGWVERPTRG
ncbi:MAG: hypothetical protein FJ027_18975 [Candidatus Rokubacteria bacterium]|nr:hypothetical protein [Candidatus Rokubacteria bacterium]